MTTEPVSGGEFINSIFTDMLSDDSFYLGSYLTWGNLASETWNTQLNDHESRNRNLNWKSAEGSVISFKRKDTGDDTKGSETGSLSVVGKPEGLISSSSWNLSWTENSQNDKTSFNLTYLGDKSTKADDISYKLSYSSKYSEVSDAVNTETANLDFSNADWAYKFSESLSGNQSTWKGNGLISLIDKNDKTSFSASYAIVNDTSKDTSNIALSNLKYIVSDYNITVAKYSKILSVAQFQSLPEISPESIDLDTIKGNISSFLNYFDSADSKISITSKIGTEINAGAGNDTITGGIGNDTITAGAGKDKITGGKGDDIFKISKSDFDFTSAKTVLADVITDFKYAATEKDSISLDGFGSVAVFQTIALAKKAGSTANVIYESKTGNFWYNEDGDSALVGALLFANAKGIPDTYWTAAGVM